MRYYSVYVKDLVKRRFWTVDVEADDITPASNILRHASFRQGGADAIGFKEYLCRERMIDAGFDNGRIREGLDL